MKKNELQTNEVSRIIRYIKKNEMDFFDIPESLRYHDEIVRFQRKLGLRESGKRGYDVIHNRFFVEELIVDIEKKIVKTFEKFNDYYDFLEGDIYESSCYYQCELSKLRKSKIDFDENKIFEKSSFIEEIIDDYKIEEIAEEDLRKYTEGEKRKQKYKEWIYKFNECDDVEKLKEVVKKYNRTKLSKKVRLEFFFNNYMQTYSFDENRLGMLMEYVESGGNCAHFLLLALPEFYNPQDVLDRYTGKSENKRQYYKNRGELKKYIENQGNKKFNLRVNCYFCEETHFFYESTINCVCQINRYFDTLEDLLEYRGNDLKNCSLSKYTNTRVTADDLDSLSVTIKKSYDLKKECFKVEKKWKNARGKVIESKAWNFDYFFDFLFFLKGDLSNANLMLCSGLMNLQDTSRIDFTNAKLVSEFNDRIGKKYELIELKSDLVKNFSTIKKNELVESTAVVSRERDALALAEDEEDKKVHYISDLHLEHKVENAKCKSKEDVLNVLNKLVLNMLSNVSGDLILIAGDTSADINLFKMFLKVLKENKEDYIRIVFSLGNHDLWGFNNKKIESIVKEYKKVIKGHGMYLIHNNILYIGKSGAREISAQEILTWDRGKLRNKVRKARVILFGGIGFAGYNSRFNANKGIYRDIINRDEEIEETKKFEKLYNIVSENLSDKKVVILTHMPKEDWCKKKETQKNFIYVSGHTHLNKFYDDGEYRYYADNQSGYIAKTAFLKYFFLNEQYDYFADFPSGIYKISRDKYREFYRGMNIYMTFNREIHELYMIKKQGYYCFLHKSVKGVLSILNGGSMKNLKMKDIEYYYDNMDQVIASVKAPLDKFNQIQKQISDVVKKIGGTGLIHGCIIDINFYNHIYLNPVDLKAIGYWAEDIVEKVVYPTIQTLLKKRCPELFLNYTKMISKDEQELNQLMKMETKTEFSNGKSYLETDIYDASRKMKRLQKINKKILVAWPEEIGKLIKGAKLQIK